MNFEEPVRLVKMRAFLSESASKCAVVFRFKDAYLDREWGGNRRAVEKRS
jgi:hypothetical protein